MNNQSVLPQPPPPPPPPSRPASGRAEPSTKLDFTRPNTTNSVNIDGTTVTYTENGPYIEDSLLFLGNYRGEKPFFSRRYFLLQNWQLVRFQTVDDCIAFRERFAAASSAQEAIESVIHPKSCVGLSEIIEVGIPPRELIVSQESGFVFCMRTALIGGYDFFIAETEAQRQRWITSLAAGRASVYKENMTGAIIAPHSAMKSTPFHQKALGRAGQLWPPIMEWYECTGLAPLHDQSDSEMIKLGRVAKIKANLSRGIMSKARSIAQTVKGRVGSAREETSFLCAGSCVGVESHLSVEFTRQLREAVYPSGESLSAGQTETQAPADCDTTLLRFHEGWQASFAGCHDTVISETRYDELADLDFHPSGQRLTVFRLPNSAEVDYDWWLVPGRRLVPVSVASTVRGGFEDSLQ